MRRFVWPMMWTILFIELLLYYMQNPESRHAIQLIIGIPLSLLLLCIAALLLFVPLCMVLDAVLNRLHEFHFRLYGKWNYARLALKCGEQQMWHVLNNPPGLNKQRQLFRFGHAIFIVRRMRLPLFRARLSGSFKKSLMNITTQEQSWRQEMNEEWEKTREKK